MNRLGKILLAAACLAIPDRVAKAVSPVEPRQLEFFEQRIRPFLANDCYECHGAKKQKGGLRLDSRDGLRKGGESGPALIPGQAARSLLIQAITHQHADIRMPKDRPKLADAVLADFVRWVDEGAPDPRDQPPAEVATGSGGWENVFKARQDWWSFKPLKKTAVPQVKNPGWSELPVDRFILSKLEEKGIQPAPAASPGAWLRRVHFAITGLPPTADEVRAFVEDTAPGARERVVDRLLASPGFGERWARHWMDLIRFAESYGHEQDYTIPHVWRYRDYLIRAFNADVPYRQFVTEHLAGDLLKVPRRDPATGFNESIVATGFWFLHQATHAPVDPIQDEADRIDNQVDVFSKTFLGLTVGCARCHDHKFDAISSRDYYSLTAFLRGSRQDIACVDPNGRLELESEKLRRLHEEDTGGLRAMMKKVRASGGPVVAPYLLAAHEVLHGRPRPSDDLTNRRPDIVFEDFEDGTYRRWKVEGDAFGTEPATGKHPKQQAVEGFRGKRLANSFTKGDAPKGALRSEPFRVDRSHIQFLLGGGVQSRKARFVLRVNDREVRSASGPNREQLEPMVWDVREFAGKEARLEILDEDDSVWGHINIDDIIFTDRPVNNPLIRPIAVVAAERHLDSPRLEGWVTELLSPAAQNVSHPLHPWLAAMARESQSDPGQSPKPGSKPGSKPDAKAGPAEASPVYEDFPAPDFAQWFPSGQAFSPVAGFGADWRVADKSIEFIPAGVVHSGRIDRGLQGTLRSPTFKLTHDNIHLRLAGSGGQVRLIIARYGLREFNPLLFEKTLFDVNTEGRFVWHSISSGLSRHIGRLAYLEIIDGGDGYVALDRVVFSKSPKPPAEIQGVAALPGTISLADQARAFESAVHVELDSWINNDRRDTNSLALLSWLSQKRLLDWGRAEAGLAGIARRAQSAAAGLVKPARVLAMTDGTVEETRVLVRGDHKNPGPAVSRRFLEAVAGPAPAAIARGSGRLELADALLSDGNPFTYRVIVNRVWAHLFGRGLVATVDNLGTMGQPPTHPELLDNLALSFREGGGSIKQLIRSLCLTRAYGMSSSPDDPLAEARDPDNALLHRQRLMRLEGEIIRDNLLAVAGQLNRAQFGPSVPAHVTAFMGNNIWIRNANGPMDGNRRRSVYLETRRNLLSSMMTTFDLPVPDTTVGQRNSSNVPGQALTLMNDPFVRAQAEALGRECVRAPGLSAPERIEQLFLRAFARPPRPAETERLLALLKSQAEALGVAADDINRSPAVWSELCHVVFMMKEFIHVP